MQLSTFKCSNEPMKIIDKITKIKIYRNIGTNCIICRLLKVLLEKMVRHVDK